MRASHTMMACPPGKRNLRSWRMGAMGPQPVAESSASSTPVVSTAELVGFGAGVVATIIGETQGLLFFQAFGTSLMAAAMFSALSRDVD